MTKVEALLILLVAALIGVALALDYPGPGGKGVAVAASDQSGWITYRDYPQSALRAGQTGTVQLSLRIGPDGTPRSCTIEESSGVPALDEASCKALRERARFKPPLDRTGKPAEATFRRRVRWELSGDSSDDVVASIAVSRAPDGRFVCDTDVEGTTRALLDAQCQSFGKELLRAGRPLDRRHRLTLPDTPEFLQPEAG